MEPRSSDASTGGETAALRLATFLPYRLNVLAAAVSEGLARIYGERFGVAVPEWRVLAALGESGSLTATAIGRHARMSKVKVSRAAASLEDRSLIRRVPNAQDRREAFLALTGEGEAMYRAIVPLAHDYARRLTSGLSTADLACLDGLVDRLTRSADALGGSTATTARGAGKGRTEVPLMSDFSIQVVPVTPFQQNCSLAWSAATKRGVVVDPGGDVPMIRAAIDQAGVTIDAILLTHGHIDHAGGAAELKEALGGVEIVGPHEGDRPLLDRLEQQGRSYGIAGVRNVTPDRWLREGDRLTIADVPFEVLHVPGHSPGSVVLFAPSLRFCFMGDVLFQGSVGRTDLPGGSHDALIQGILTKVLPLGDDVSFLPGHGSGSTLGAEKATNPFLR